VNGRPPVKNHVSRKSTFRAGQMVRMMVTVTLRKHLDRHPEIARGFPHIGTSLHQPRRCGVTENVRRHVVAESSICYGVGKGFVDTMHRLSVPLDGETLS